MKRTLLGLLCLLFMLPTLTAAQTNDDTGWPVIEHCLGEPTAPPEGRTLEAVILLEDNDAVRGLSADFDTTYIIAFRDEFLDGAALSPDGRWYAVPFGHTEYASMADRRYVMEQLVVYSTDGRRDTLQIPWQLSWRTAAGWVYPLVWLDNQHLIYERTEKLHEIPKTWIVNPFTGEEEIWDKDLKDLKESGLSPVSPINSITSPDLTRTIYNDWQRETFQDNWKLYNFDTGEALMSLSFLLDPYLSGVRGNPTLAWRPDSSGFAAWTNYPANAPENRSRTLMLFDRDGNLTDTVATASNDDSVSLRYSPDSRWLMFFIAGHWQMADLENRNIVDTCLAPITNFTWSSNGRQAVFKYQDKVVSFISETNEFYIVGSYDSRIVGWRAD